MFKEGDVVEYLGGGFWDLTVGCRYKITCNNLGLLQITDDVNSMRDISILRDYFKIVSPTQQSEQSTLPKYIKWSDRSTINYVKLSKSNHFSIIGDYITVDVGHMSYRIIKDDVTNFDEIKDILIKYFEEGL